MNLVVFKLNNLGDNVVFVPAVQELRRRCPDWTITLLTNPEAAELYRGPLGPHEVITCPKKAFNQSYRRPWEFARWFWRIRRRGPDACLVPFDQGSAAHALARLSGARVRVGAKLETPRMPGSLTQEVPLPPDGRPVTWNWAAAETLARAFGRGSAWPVEPPPPDFSHLVGRTPGPAGRRVVVHAGASRPLNQWPVGNFAAVAAALSRDFEVVWISHGGSTGSAPVGVTEARVRTIGELAGKVAAADLFLGNNSGPMHLANALGCSGVVVTGPSAAGWDPYWHRERWSVLRHPNLKCCPCERIQEELAGCINVESPMACLAHWTPEKVEQECRRRLSQPPAPRAAQP